MAKKGVTGRLSEEDKKKLYDYGYNVGSGLEKLLEILDNIEENQIHINPRGMEKKLQKRIKNKQNQLKKIEKLYNKTLKRLEKTTELVQMRKQQINNLDTQLEAIKVSAEEVQIAKDTRFNEAVERVKQPLRAKYEASQKGFVRKAHECVLTDVSKNYNVNPCEIMKAIPEKYWEALENYDKYVQKEKVTPKKYHQDIQDLLNAKIVQNNGDVKIENKFEKRIIRS
ncbi:coiled-coil domain-containing protein [Methanosphaera cuniculi]|uniref:Chromosome partition protein Smc n=1 Tax=Methanosphaera cuniculi TaxID=1077256 RepID=A0A2A2HDG5_9EURY|nr:hypothetical protein [Methanosphaera cuniculi]PAV07541.1 hypothetical protein ASJ82_07645 [Methanosphaera cuniculi]PWL08143.1 hypothetical protein MSCUN_10740 [Methanosphaera cuniculi]